jgi:hypothetical protein
MPVALGLKVAALGAAAATGAAGLVWSAGASEPQNPAAVWIDGPLTGFSVQPGLVPVTAHASAAQAVGRLLLLVDGQQVAEDTSLERSGLLSLGTFGWQATAGRHTLVVKAGSTSSEVVNLLVAAHGNAPTPTAVPTTVPVRATPTPTRSVTPSPTSSPTPRTSPTPARSTAPATTSPTPSPSPKPALPVYAAGSISFNPASWYWDTRYSSGSPCGSSFTQQSQGDARVTGATSVQIVVGGHAFAATASGSTWTATIRSADIPGRRIDSTLTVQVVAVGPGGTTTRDAGTVLLRSCEKD